MKICQWCDYTAPAKDSMGAERVIEYITKGLLELGHDVVMKLNPNSKNTIAPLINEIPQNCDIIHYHGFNPEGDPCENLGIPYVQTIHGGGTEEDPKWLLKAKEKRNTIICVSKFVSDRIKCPAYVHTCVDPSEFIYKHKKDNYFLWMAGTDWGEGKGLFSTIQYAKKMRINLKIAGAGRNKQIIEQIKSLCDNKIEFIGAINGKEKAEYLANAKGFFLLTRLPDACPATISESLISGTPVIGSINGSLPELIKHGKTGFLCKSDSDVIKAIINIKNIKPNICREEAINKFSYIEACKKFLMYYKNLLKTGNVIGDLNE